MKSTTIVGDKIGRLTIISLPPHDPYKPQLAKCDCECGGSVTAPLSAIRFGNTLSCGCLRREASAARRLKHGHSSNGLKTSEYQIWKSMKQRCSNPNNKAYNNYGGRGIKVCARWTNSFANFINDMGLKPSRHHTIERKDNDGGYNPSNCRWATRIENGNNKRNSRVVTFKGESLTLAMWARKLGIGVATFTDRFKYGWPIEKIFSSKKYKPHSNKNQ